MALGEEWQERGACRGIRVEFFFPPVDQEADEAKAVCSMCSVQDACLEFAISAGERFGVWGGLTPQERQALVSQRKREAAKEPVPS